MKIFKSFFVIAALFLTAITTFAATVTVTDQGCPAYAVATSGANVIVTCGAATPTQPPQPPSEPPPPISRGTPAGCTIIPITWSARLSLTFHPKSVMVSGQAFAFQKRLDPQGLSYASASYATTSKYMSISKSPCDFSPELEAKGCAMGAGRGNDVSLNYAPIGTNQPGYCEVDSGDYYINVRNSTTRDGPDTCPAGMSCEYWLSW